MGEVVSQHKASLGIGVFEKGIVVMVSYGRTFDPVEHINPLMVLEGGKVSHAVLLGAVSNQVRKTPGKVQLDCTNLRHCAECALILARSFLFVRFAAIPFLFLWGGRALRLRGVGVDLHLRGVKGYLRLRYGSDSIHLYKFCGFWLWLKIGIQ